MNAAAVYNSASTKPLASTNIISPVVDADDNDGDEDVDEDDPDVDAKSEISLILFNDISTRSPLVNNSAQNLQNSKTLLESRSTSPQTITSVSVTNNTSIVVSDNPSLNTSNSQLSCAVCGDVSSGKHYGIAIIIYRI